MSSTRSSLAASSSRRLALVAVALLSACAQPGGEETAPGLPEDTRLSVYAVNYPVAYFAERIGGEQVRVTLPVPVGTDPADWTPEARQILEFQQADLVLLNGAGYAGWVQTASLPNNRLVDTSRAFLDSLIPLEDPTHSHGPAGDHSHGTTATHTWLDPALAIEQARAILDSLLIYRPEEETEFRSRFAVLTRDLEVLDQELAEAFAAIGDEPLLFSHPVYQYLARRYAPSARSLDWEPDVVPNDAALESLRRLRDGFPATILIWEQEPFAVTVELLENEGLRSIAFDPGSRRPADRDYMQLMRWNLANLRRVAPAAPPNKNPR